MQKRLTEGAYIYYPDAPWDCHTAIYIYSIYAYIGVVWGVNVGIYSIHGVYGVYIIDLTLQGDFLCFKLRLGREMGRMDDLGKTIVLTHTLHVWN